LETTQDCGNHLLVTELYDAGNVSGSDPVMARFRLDGTTCVVVSVPRLNRENGTAKPADYGCLQGEIAGTLLVNKEQFLVCIVDEPPPQAADGLGRQMLSEILTRRELQVASLVAEGKVNKQIAGLLGISEWTVSTHIRRTFAKLGVHSRAAMAAHVASHFSGLVRE
jgi:DNA-binding CsgD family transcriptional regulator